MAKTYLTAMQLYWQYRLKNAKSGISNTSSETATTGVDKDNQE